LEHNLTSTKELRQVSQEKYDLMKKEIIIKERENDLKNLAIIIQRIKELRRELKKNNTSDEKSENLLEIQKIESNLEISRAKALQIRLKHDLPTPSLEEEETTYDDTTNESSQFTFIEEAQVTQESEESIFSIIGATVDDMPESNEPLDPQQKVEKIAALSSKIIELEAQLQTAIELEIYEKSR